MDPAQPQSPQAAPTVDGPVGLGGWLVLPLVGAAITPFASVAALYPDLSSLGDVWGLLTGTQKIAIVADVVIKIVGFVVAPVVLLILAAQKLEIFPGLYIVWSWVAVGIVIASSIAAWWVFQEQLAADEIFDPQFYRDLGRNLVQAVIWTAYMNMSKRVENTFVN